MKTIKRPSTGEQAAVRDALVTKIKEVEAGMKRWREIFVTVLETYPANTENVFMGGKYAAVTLINNAVEIGKLVHDLDPEKTGKATVEATIEATPLDAGTGAIDLDHVSCQNGEAHHV